MKKIFICIFSLILLCHASLIIADQNSDESQYNSNTFQVITPDYDIADDEITIDKGIQKFFWDKNNLKAEGPVKNRQKEGFWSIYFNETEGKALKAQGSYLRNERNGQWILYHENGKTLSRQTYKKQ